MKTVESKNRVEVDKNAGVDALRKIMMHNEQLKREHARERIRKNESVLKSYNIK
jgi:hypothetical protein